MSFKFNSYTGQAVYCCTHDMLCFWYFSGQTLSPISASPPCIHLLSPYMSYKPIGLQENCFKNMNKQVHCKVIHPF